MKSNLEINDEITEVIELKSKIFKPIKGFYSIQVRIKINGDKETDTNIIAKHKKDLKLIKVGFKWIGEYWGQGS